MEQENQKGLQRLQWNNTLPAKLSDCFGLGKPKFTELLKTHGQQQLTDFLAIGLGSLFDFYKVTNKPDLNQVNELAGSIIKSYSDYTIEVFTFFLSEAKKGVFEKVYNRLDVPMINEWLRLFDEKYEYEKAHKVDRHKTNKQLTSNERAGFICEILKDVNFKPKREPIPKRELSEEEKKHHEHIQNLYIEFDKIYASQGNRNGMIKLIEFEGQLIDSSTYIHLKTKP